MDSQNNAPGPRPVPPPAEYEPCPAGALPSAQMAFVQEVQEKFLSAFAEELGDRLETLVSAQLDAAQPLPPGEFQRSGEDGGCMFTLDAAPVRGQVLVAFSPNLVAYLLRIILGAPPSAGNDTRPVTEIELHILREIFDLLARCLTTAWKAAGIAFRWTSNGIREPASGQGTMLAFECRMELDGAEETFRIAIPAFLARMAALQSAPAAAEEVPSEVRETILNAMRGGSVNVEGVLCGSTLRMGDLLAMEPGHVLMLGQPAGSPVEFRISGKPKFRGEWIDHGNRQALVLL